MKKIIVCVAVLAIAIATGICVAGDLFTSVSSYPVPTLITEVNAALDALEDNIDGSTPMTSPVVKGTLTAISTNAATTNVVITVDGVVDGATIGATTLTVAQGGSGAATLTDGGIVLGSGTAAVTVLGVAANGQIPIGDGATDPVLATITPTAGETEIANGAGTITVGLPATVTGVTTISNATLTVSGQTLQIVSGGTVAVPAGSISVASLGIGGTYPANSGASITAINAANVTGDYGAGDGANITNINAANVSGTYGAGSGAAITGVVLDSEQIASVSMSVAFNNATNGVVEMQLKTRAGANPGAMYPATIWVSKTALGAADTSDMDVVSSITVGSEIFDHNAANDMYTALTDADGKISWAFESSNPAFTNFFYCGVGGVVVGVVAVEIPGTP